MCMLFWKPSKQSVSRKEEGSGASNVDMSDKMRVEN